MLTTSPLSTPALASRLRLVITRTARLMRQQADPALSPSMVAALATIERVGPVTPSEVAAHERVQRPTVTRVVARLVELGLVERLADERDGRARRLRVTPAGRRALGTLRTRKTAFLAGRLELLEPDERAVLERASVILERLLESDA
jgi:DNA-binding MarR family transcriptional regulator